ncbi:hypothetical protein KEM48_006802 [Puccinia striiformis f. sp. tritici PST-130]|uniref:Uncharacterized protein n=2 Tax=Puccinia striiformis TaxID=27350 RepID=A0A0L0VF49_9BASI|nr:hypothetical protein KEM48_006802 [Puccinia striiformis f. sp. tritici PST-130]KNE97888.1 hypothetical protein PSTG_08910 [Puccinia striiformis f. sp. tritici PST-78]POW04865.1 hypothetical protein PSTT_10081 [Puccinia striiformis]
MPITITSPSPSTHTAHQQLLPKQTHLRCSIRKKLLEGVLDSEGDIAPGFVLPRLSEITQVMLRFLSPDEAKISNKEAQKKITILLTGRMAHIRLQTANHLLHQ